MGSTDGNQIHPTAVIAPSVRIGKNNFIGAFTTIEGDVTIGDDNWIGPHVTIGTPAQYTTSKYEFTGQPVTGIRIGNRCVLREYTTVHQPSKFETVVEDDCYFMAYCHISHDTRIRCSVALANNTQIGGFTEVGEYTTIGLSAIIHQYSTIGAYAMIGMGSVITKDVPPFAKVLGNPAVLAGVNAIGMERNGFDATCVAEVERALRQRTYAPASERLRPFFERFTARCAQTKRPLLEITTED
ncbi:MAG: UDP-N-acetylglucosamine acyltransferase [Candidatus Eremiobacteraeota bacterium]|nr:UDP-N-acetylglucosamine acyltransferase [Candidatus Eremiobacteraeota bacterium]